MEQDKAIGKAIVYIENHLYEPLNAVMVSEAVSYSYYHFHRYFLFAMGETIGSYIRSRRLTQAGYELVHSNKKIVDIALSLYFESAESFTRAFKKKYKITPREYRKRGIDVLIASHPAFSPDTVNHRIVLPPELVTVPPKRIVGLSFKMSIADNRSPVMWERFNAYFYQLLNSSDIGCRYSFYEGEESCQQSTFHEKQETNAFIGVEWEEGPPPTGMSIKEFSGGDYAKFVHRGSVDTLLSTYQYIWGIWFPQSGWELAERDDFECYTERFLGPMNKNSEIEIYFPIQKTK